MLIVGCPVKDRGWSLPYWFNALAEQNIEMEIVCFYTPSEDNTEEILKQGGATILYDQEAGRSRYEIDGHCWGRMSDYEYISRLRNSLADYAFNKGADYFFSLDSDIILPPDAITPLLEFLDDNHGVVAPAVNMTAGHIAINTTVWNFLSFTGSGGERNPLEPKTQQVDVVMAAMLMDRSGMECRWEAHKRGEDIGFSLDAESKNVPRWWYPDIRCKHLMRRF